MGVRVGWGGRGGGGRRRVGGGEEEEKGRREATYVQMFFPHPTTPPLSFSFIVFDEIIRLLPHIVRAECFAINV